MGKQKGAIAGLRDLKEAGETERQIEGPNAKPTWKRPHACATALNELQTQIQNAEELKAQQSDGACFKEEVDPEESPSGGKWTRIPSS